MVKARKYVVKKYFEGLPKRDDYEMVEYELPPLKDGEFLVKTEWISVDPYLRAVNRMISVPYDQFSYQVGVIQESKNPKFPVGARVVSHKGWTDYAILNGNPSDDLAKVKPYLLPELKGTSSSLGLGVIGMPGSSAYFGFEIVLKPRAGETFVVSGAAGAVGSIVGQIAKFKGCRVIGFAGSDAKVEWLEKDLGFDKAINYKTADLAKALKEAAPNGVDVYFDNVGGELSKIVMSQMKPGGRVGVCGAISVYNDDTISMANYSLAQPTDVSHPLKIDRINYLEHMDRYDEALIQLRDWVKDGKIKAREHVTESFDKLVDAMVGMLNGENIGKAVVKV